MAKTVKLEGPFETGTLVEDETGLIQGATTLNLDNPEWEALTSPVGALTSRVQALEAAGVFTVVTELPATGETGQIYLLVADGITSSWVWSGADFQELMLAGEVAYVFGPRPATGEEHTVYVEPIGSSAARTYMWENNAWIVVGSFQPLQPTGLQKIAAAWTTVFLPTDENASYPDEFADYDMFDLYMKGNTVGTVNGDGTYSGLFLMGWGGGEPIRYGYLQTQPGSEFLENYLDFPLTDGAGVYIPESDTTRYRLLLDRAILVWGDYNNGEYQILSGTYIDNGYAATIYVTDSPNPRINEYNSQDVDSVHLQWVEHHIFDKSAGMGSAVPRVPSDSIATQADVITFVESEKDFVYGASSDKVRIVTDQSIPIASLIVTRQYGLQSDGTMMVILGLRGDTSDEYWLQTTSLIPGSYAAETNITVYQGSTAPMVGRSASYSIVAADGGLQYQEALVAPGVGRYSSSLIENPAMTKNGEVFFNTDTGWLYYKQAVTGVITGIAGQSTVSKLQAQVNTLQATVLELNARLEGKQLSTLSGDRLNIETAAQSTGWIAPDNNGLGWQITGQGINALLGNTGVVEVTEAAGGNTVAIFDNTGVLSLEIGLETMQPYDIKDGDMVTCSGMDNLFATKYVPGS